MNMKSPSRSPCINNYHLWSRGYLRISMNTWDMRHLSASLYNCIVKKWAWLAQTPYENCCITFGSYSYCFRIYSKTVLSFEPPWMVRYILGALIIPKANIMLFLSRRWQIATYLHSSKWCDATKIVETQRFRSIVFCRRLLCTWRSNHRKMIGASPRLLVKFCIGGQIKTFLELSHAVW